jgi:hypothetical protein
MPTGTCKYPGHHSNGGAGQVFSWVVILALAAIIVTHWHTVVVCLIAAAVPIIAGIPVVLLIHNHKNSQLDEALERQPSSRASSGSRSPSGSSPRYTTTYTCTVSTPLPSPPQSKNPALAFHARDNRAGHVAMTGP